MVGVRVLIGVAGELSELDEGGVAGIGVSGGDKGDECLGNEEVSSSMLAVKALQGLGELDVSVVL